MAKLFYAGIGSKQTPEYIKTAMTEIASRLEALDFVLRSGGALGADTAFERGVKNIINKEIFYADDILKDRFGTTQKAIELLESTHPYYHKISNRYSIALLARDGYQVLGSNLDTPSKFIICWTKNGEIRGGTGQAMRIAKSRNIPIYNLAIQEDISRLNKLISDLESIQ